MEKKWWHDKVAYQIYPKSFYDTDGDGIGDLCGIIEKLDYLKDLGIDIIWISPIYQSPFVDQGYDISDYYKIAAEFGTMEEFDRLLAEAKKRGMEIVMDLVINHCSDQHEWFQKALKDPEGEYGDYFYFEKGKNGGAPSNYRSYFGGSAWEPVPGTELYYLHMFAKEQPDLNWNNPKMKEELFTMIRWWLEKGVAGFRIDAIINIKKDISFPDFPADGPDGLAACTRMVDEVDGVGQLLEELRTQTFDRYQAFTVAEVFNMKEEELKEFVGDQGHFSTMFDFSAHMLTGGEHGWYDAKPVEFNSWRKAIMDSQKEVENVGFLANIIENHDEPRGASTYLPDYASNDRGVKMLAASNVLLRGIPFLYQGQEIGMRNCPMESIEEYDDISTLDQYEEALKAGCTAEEALDICICHSRDNARTPMQWSGNKQAGFTTGSPWLKVNPNYTEINVENQEQDEDSVLHYYRKLIALRKAERSKDIFTYGKTEPVFEEEEGIFAFYRTGEDGKRILVAANYGKEARKLVLDEAIGEILLTNNDKKQGGTLCRVEADGRTISLESCGVLVAC